MYKCMIWNYSISDKLHQWAIDVHIYMLSCINSFQDTNVIEVVYMQRVTVFLSRLSHEKVQLIHKYIKKHVIFQNNETILKESYSANNHV